MCANYLPIRPEHAHLLDLPQMTFDYQAEVYPSDRSPIIIAPEQQPEWRRAIFGLVPVWAKDLKIVQKTFNARSETASEKPSFRHAWKSDQFALIPVEVFFEPRYIEGKAQRWGIYRKDGQPFTIAAIYERTKLEKEFIHSMSMLTINAEKHPLMSQFHKPGKEKRSVVVIPPELRLAWLQAPHQEAQNFLTRFPAEDFIAEHMPYSAQYDFNINSF